MRVLLDDENPWVRLAAATYLLEVDEPNAIRILKEIGTQHGFVSLDAKIILDQWRTERKSFIPDLPES